MKEKYSYLIKNTGILTISNFGSKFLSVLLVPLYTSILSTEEYGTYDFIATSIELMLPVFTLNIFDAVFRFAMDKEENRHVIFRVGMKIYYMSLFGVMVFLVINSFLNVFRLFENYNTGWILLYASMAFYSFMQQYAKACERIKSLAIAGVLNTITICICNILFLLVFKWRLNGYLAAYILGAMIPSLYLFIEQKCYRILVLTTDKEKGKLLQKEMIRYSRPLILTNISWWIISASDRYMVTGICGIAQNGIYSIAYKIPNILSTVQHIFSQAWLISAVREFDTKDHDFFYRKVYNQYCAIHVLLCSIIILLTRPISSLLYADEFYEAWRFVPWLVISSLFSGLSGYMGGILTAKKDTKALSMTTFSGAIFNVIFNFIFLFRYGTVGAAYATVLSYFLTWLLRIVSVFYSMRCLLITMQEIVLYGLLFAEAFLICINPSKGFMILAFFLCFLICIITLIMLREFVSMTYDKTKEIFIK